MNGPGDLTVTHSSATPDPKNCSLVSIIPIVGMSSCRGRAEAFARRLSSKLRTLGTQADEADPSQEDEPIINGGNTNTWVTGGDGGEQTVTDLQPLRHESDSFFDFDCELESPGSPVDECEYLRLIESTSNTPHNSAAESGYACASAASSHSSSDGPYFDVNSENEACMSHLHPHQLQTSNHICQPHHQASKDEVDCTSSTSTSKQMTETGQCNGYNSHHEDLTQTLPSEGPDIDRAKEQEETLHMESSKQIDISQSVQAQILRELHQQSLDYKDEEEDNNKKNLQEQDTNITEDTTKVTETETTATKEEELKPEQELKQVVHIINGHGENGEDVLKVEVEEVIPAAERKDEKEEEVKKQENDSNENVPSITKDSKQELEVPMQTETEKTKTSHLHMDTTDDEDDCRPQRIRRCSSLKTGKTPPGTPGRKKIVRFADVLGLDLADVKTFLDEIPTIPKSAYEDLEILESEPPLQLGPKSDKILMPLFQQPGGLPNYLDIVREKLVSLENAAVTDNINHTITGSVRVRNLDFHKSVHIRYTLDGWRSFADLQANYVENSCDGFSDKFSFILFGNSLHIGQRLEFAVRFQCKGQQYWDNNYGSNYCFQCLPASAPVINPISTMLPSHHSNNMVALLSPTVGETWCTSFY
ncbi:glycogen-binding subunit 76A [Lucilia cuprina]|uniref:glycogen-binding subunit 76A n=1 Tax=Lucilia cuprina TaxID=7375 RepID=UPI001F06259B|nr:glycogen-binding subunit 76A [Lucilia cuprina]